MKALFLVFFTTLTEFQCDDIGAPGRFLIPPLTFIGIDIYASFKKVCLQKNHGDH